MKSALLCAALVLGSAEDEYEQCLAGGCASLPTYPECEYSCDEIPYIGPESGNTRQIWPVCPGGPGACQDCQDTNPSCPAFAAAYNGFGCEDNPAYMIDVCAKSCNTCHLRDLAVRCAGIENEPRALRPGDLNATFQRALSLPGLNAEVLSHDPWILRFPKFLTEDEIAFLLDPKIHGEEWKEASDQGGLDERGRVKQVYSSHRSTGVKWCGLQCHEHPVGKRLRARISELTRVHPHYFESFQFLRYTKGQYYKSHHDSASTDTNSPSGHRIYTFFLYLSDVESGGDTTFPQLDIRVKPERGSAILWPSVYNHDPAETDLRTSHQAEVVEAGTKYSSNIWIHQGPYTLAHYLACSRSPIG